jgi:hypothetical protein
VVLVVLDIPYEVMHTHPLVQAAAAQIVLPLQQVAVPDDQLQY